MTPRIIGLIAIAAYLVAVAAIGLFGRRLARDADMFNIFGRRAKAIRATAGYLSLIGGGELITITQLGHDNGWDVFWFIGGVALGFLALAALASPIKAIADKRKINTLSGFYADQFGPAAGLGSTVIFVLSLGSLLTIQFIVGSDLLSSLLGLPHIVSILVMGSVILLYLIPAGIVAVLSTDVLRAIMMSLVLIVVVFYAGTHVSGGMPHFDPLPAPDNFIYLILGFFGAIAAADVWQTLLASRDISVVRSSLISGAVAFLAIGALLAELGMLTRAALPNLAADTPAFVAAATQVIPGVFAPLVAVLVTGSVMATADTEIWVISTLLLSNVRPSLADKSQHGAITSPHDLQTATRYILPIVAVIAMVTAYFSADAQAIYTGLLSLLSASGVAMLAALFLHPKNHSIALSLWAGVAAFVVLSIAYQFNVPVLLSLAPLVAAALGYAVGMFIPRNSRVSAE